MNDYTEILLQKAFKHCEELSKHIVLGKYWSEIALVLKGSTAMGKADQYSDIDFVIYCEKEVKEKIVKEYKQRGITNRDDNIFIFLENNEGHYHIEAVEEFENYFETKNYPQIWGISKSKLLHDPFKKIEKLRDAKLNSFKIEVENDIKNKYLEAQLQLDWLRHVLIRGDEIASMLYCQNVIKNILELAYLVEKKPYPHDKWIGSYLEETEFGQIYKAEVIDYVRNILDESGLESGKSLECYAQYTIPEKFISFLGEVIIENFGEQPWVMEWYNYV